MLCEGQRVQRVPEDSFLPECLSVYYHFLIYCVIHQRARRYEEQTSMGLITYDIYPFNGLN